MIACSRPVGKEEGREEGKRENTLPSRGVVLLRIREKRNSQKISILKQMKERKGERGRKEEEGEASNDDEDLQRPYILLREIERIGRKEGKTCREKRRGAAAMRLHLIHLANSLSSL